MEAQLRELFQFLHDKNPQVRQIALSNLLSQTPKGSPQRAIFFEGLSNGGLKDQKDSSVLRDLKLLCRDQPDIAHDAFRALINLSDSALVVPSLSEVTFMTFLISYTVYPSSILSDLASMLLSNLTAHPGACKVIIDLSIPVIIHSAIPGGFYPPDARAATVLKPNVPPGADSKDVVALELLVEAFIQAARGPILQDNPLPNIWKGSLNFVASIFANVSVLPEGRLFFLTPRNSLLDTTRAAQEYPLSRIIAFTEHEDTIRRGGAASTIKNCCFHTPAHKAILSPETIDVLVPPSEVEASGIDALPQILLPLAGPEEFDLDDQEKLHPSLQLLPSTKKRERDPVLRLTHVESLLLLCTTRWGRETLRENGVYEIVRTAHKCEHDEKVLEHIERLVNLLMREEAAIEEVHDETSLPKNDGLDDDDDAVVEV